MRTLTSIAIIFYYMTLCVKAQDHIELFRGYGTVEYLRSVGGFTDANAVLVKSYTESFKLGGNLKLFKLAHWQLNTSALIQFVFGAKRNSGPTVPLLGASTDIELGFSALPWLQVLSGLHGQFTRQNLQDVTIQSLEDLRNALSIRLNSDDFTLWRFGLRAIFNELSEIEGTTVSTTLGIQPIKPFSSGVTEHYDRPFYFDILGSYKILKEMRVTLEFTGETGNEHQSSFELRLSSLLHIDPKQDRIQVGIGYMNIVANSIIVSPTLGIVTQQYLLFVRCNLY